MNISSLQTIREFHEEYQKVQDPAAYEKKVALLVKNFLLAGQLLTKQGVKVDAASVQVLQDASSNLQKVLGAVEAKFPKGSVKAKGFETASKAISMMVQKLDGQIRKQAQQQQVQAEKKEREEVQEAVGQFDDIFRATLGCKVPKKPDDLRGRLQEFLKRLDKLEGAEGSPEYRESNSGSLARGVYGEIWNRIQYAAEELSKPISLKKYNELVSWTAKQLSKAKYLQDAKKDPQAARALTLMKIDELLNKCELYLDVKGMKKEKAALINFKATLTQELSKFDSSSTEDLWKVYDTVSDHLISLPWTDQWREPVEKEWSKSKPFDTLIYECISALEQLK